ncbi:basic helix-loop-helix (bHLH) DNA-binding superfamily protein [Euphorbia peplus]|nr:basic helix-loop-helix (bHLH) DNA-binding superfamily protein [Euphorbia peplus]
MSSETDNDMIQQKQQLFDYYGCFSFNDEEIISHNQTHTCALIDANQRDYSSSELLAAPTRRRKRQHGSTSSIVKKKEQVEHRRMTHIAVERNRRSQMNLYLSLLKSIMPPSYVHRGDQASIVGGAINFVKELEQLLHSLEAHKRKRSVNKSDHNIISKCDGLLISDFFKNNVVNEGMISEVRKVESHVNLKIVLRRQPKLMLKMLKGFQSLCLTVVHINLTTFHHMHMLLLFSLSLKVEDDCKMSSVNEISAAVYQMVGRFQQEGDSS